MKMTDLQPGLLVQTRAGDVLKVSNLYDNDTVTATTVLFEGGTLPERTIVIRYNATDIKTWKAASKQAANKVDDAYGYTGDWK